MPLPILRCAGQPSNVLINAKISLPANTTFLLKLLRVSGPPSCFRALGCHLVSLAIFVCVWHPKNIKNSCLNLIHRWSRAKVKTTSGFEDAILFFNDKNFQYIHIAQRLQLKKRIPESLKFTET
jgi:hypothetical protein